MPFNIQGPELIIILIIALIVIGPGKLPEVGQALGKSIREFRKAASDGKDEAAADVASTPRVTSPVAPAVSAPETPAKSESEHDTTAS